MKTRTLRVRAFFLLTPLALAAQAQETQRITITGSATQQAPSVAGFGDTPLSRAPFSATVIDQRALQDAGISSLADITRLDAGITDAYNAPGYINQLAVRGFTLDSRFNFRRDGLPINAETVIGQANKQSLEVLKGTSGLQAGTSAPAGLLNLVVKRPRERVRDASVAWTQDGTLEAAVDVGAQTEGIGWRVNANGARLDPQTNNARGRRWLAAGAVDARIGNTLVEAEVEVSRQSQPSVPGFSLLGSRLPNANDIDPRINLNNQAWSLPVMFAGRTGSLRVTHTLVDNAEQQIDLVAHGTRQQLKNDDRIAFPFGCSAEEAFSRYCSDGSFDYYDFRSDDERRTSDALDLAVKGRAQLGGFTHQFNAGVLFTRYVARFGRQAFNFVGTGTIDGRAVVPADPTLTDENTNRDERSTELHLQDAMQLSERWSLWAGVRHTRIQRESVRTDGSRATQYAQSLTTPWLAVSHAFTKQTQAYASVGQGIESEVVPNRERFSNGSEALPALKSRQVEFGLKHASEAIDARIALFDIRRPAANDFHTRDGRPSLDDCTDEDPCTRRIDGTANHRGVEAEAEWRAGDVSLRGSAMLLRARRNGSSDAAINGQQPTNVPTRSLKLQAACNIAAVPGLAVVGFVTHEGQRMVLPDNTVATPGWTRIDLGARFTQRIGEQTLVWRLGLDNATNRRAWQEAPYQFGHAYLYPLAPRTLHASLAVRF